MRIELIHPLLVHFPIALLTIGTFLRILAVFFKERFTFEGVAIPSFIFLICAALLAYVGYLGGDLVYEQGAAVEKCCKSRS